MSDEASAMSAVGSTDAHAASMSVAAAAARKMIRRTVETPAENARQATEGP
jgi:hypothetical protein